MTRTQRVLHERRVVLWIVAALLFLGGGLGVAFLLIEREADAREQATVEADLRGEALSVVAGDVRALRAQVQAGGETPVAPDPTKAVEDLEDRTEVPVPIPGPRGADGSPGPSGEPGKNGASGVPGTDGAAGSDSTVPGPTGPPGADSTVPGPAGPTGPVGPQGEPGAVGPQGERGEPGATGATGPAGASCEDGFSWQTPSYDPDARVCRRDGAPDPGESPSASAGAALDPRRLQYT